MSDKAIFTDYQNLIDRILSGEVRVHRLSEKSWDEVYAGNVEFEADGWKIVIFNDCGEVDYTDHLFMPDGTRIGFFEDDCPYMDPICQIDNLDEKLEPLLKAALIMAEDPYEAINTIVTRYARLMKFVSDEKVAKNLLWAMVALIDAEHLKDREERELRTLERPKLH